MARAAVRAAARELREAAAERGLPGSLKSENIAQSAHVQLELRWQAAIATHSGRSTEDEFVLQRSFGSNRYVPLLLFLLANVSLSLSVTPEGISDAIAFCDAPPGAVVAAASRGMYSLENCKKTSAPSR